jgi:hypothetical protein
MEYRKSINADIKESLLMFPVWSILQKFRARSNSCLCLKTNSQKDRSKSSVLSTISEFESYLF